MNRPSLVPEILIKDISSSLNFYRDILGFKVEFERPEEGFASISLEGGRLMLDQYTGTSAASQIEFEKGAWRTGNFEYPLGRGVNFEFAVSDLDSLCARLSNAKYPMKVPPYEKWYRVGNQKIGVRQFLVMDPDGYLLRFSQQIGTKAT